MPTPLLMTAFEPFDGRTSNASMRLLAPMLAQPPEGVVVRALPVDFRALRRTVPELVRRFEPSVFLLLGESTDDVRLRCERVARNYVDRERPDNLGQLASSSRAVRGAPDAYFTTLDPHRVLDHLEERAVPAVLSEDAGSYACNLALYLALHQVRLLGLESQVGFLHVPRHYRRTGRSLAELREAIFELAVALRDGTATRRPRPVRTGTRRPR